MDGLRLGIHIQRSGADGDFAVVNAHDVHLGVAAGIEALRLGVGENGGANAQLAVISTLGAEVGGAPQHDEGGFLVLGVKGVALAGGELDDAELEILQGALADLAQRGVAVGRGIAFFVVHDKTSLERMVVFT